METLGMKVKSLRVSFNFTQKILAEKVGLDDTTISKIENDDARPSLSSLEKIAIIFNLTSSELLKDVEIIERKEQKNE